MEQLPNIHPGEIIQEEFLVPTGITPYRLAKSIGVPPTRIAEILKGARGITPDTALRLSVFLGTTAQFWLNLQNAYDLEEAQKNIGSQLNEIQRYSAVATVQ